MGSPKHHLASFPILTPPPRRWPGPIIDAHMHAIKPAMMARYWRVAARVYRVEHAVVIADLKTGIQLRRRYGDRVQPAIWAISPRHEDLTDFNAFRARKEKLLDDIAEAGMRTIKLWFTPRFHQWSNLRLDDPRLDFLFDRVEQLGLGVLIHVADPDRWFTKRFHDIEEHGTKAEHYLQLMHRLERHPAIRFQAAHFAGSPEDLDRLTRLLDRYPNLYLDTSATKWIARELSQHGDDARDFLIHFADRILFGTDLVAMPEREKEGQREHYATRFYVHQLMWEQRGWFDSPIEDEDAAGPPRFRGMALPTEVLQRLYWDNAARLYGFTNCRNATR